jgi:hypothetical protein
MRKCLLAVFLCSLNFLFVGQVLATSLYTYGGGSVSVSFDLTISPANIPAGTDVTAFATSFSMSYPPPSQDAAGYPLGSGSQYSYFTLSTIKIGTNSAGNITSWSITGASFASYPAFAAEDPNDFYCTYNVTFATAGGTGSLTKDNDAGFCPSTANNSANGSWTGGGASGPASPTLVTMASASVSVGGSISDAAVLSDGNSPAGTISFSAFGPNDSTCANAPVFLSTVAVAGNGTYASGSFTPTLAGTYYFSASYSGDVNNNATSEACGAASESVIVVQASSTTVLSTACMTTFVENQPFTLTAAVSGDAPTGTVTFNNGLSVLCNDVALISGSATCTVSDLAVMGTDTEDGYTLTANYGGDGNNAGSTSSFGVAVTVLDAGDVTFRNNFETVSPSCPVE